MKRILTIMLLAQVAYGQTDRAIKEKEVKRIIRTLTADEMLGRSAYDEKSIFKAAAFIEKEFRKIGLGYFPGLNTYLQRFQKQQISPVKIEVSIDGRAMNPERVTFVSEKAEASFRNNLTIRKITVDNAVANKDQYFFDEAFKLYNDTSSYLVLVDSAFHRNFREFKGYFNKYFARGRKSTKVFVLGEKNANNFTAHATQHLEPLNMANVVGVLEGKSRKDEMVIFSGHYDHIGIQKVKVNGDSIANGADDDASGT